MFPLYALIFGLCATAASAQSIIPLQIYDHYSNNSLVYETFNGLYSQHNSVSFGNLDYVYGSYSENAPVLIVYRPTETSHELHGYYFPQGFATFSTYGGNQYDAIRQYFYSNHYEGYTPYGARNAYPYFHQLPLTRFVHGEEVFPQFNVVFIVPRVQHPEDHIAHYNSIVAIIPSDTNN